MSLIKCPECNKEVSNTVDTCIHCGYKLVQKPKKISEEKKEGKVIIHSYEETFIINPTVKVYKDEQYITEIARGETIELPIEENCKLTFKSSIRKKDVYVKKDYVTEIALSFNRGSGALEAITNIQSDDPVMNNINLNTYNRTIKKKKKSNAKWVILAIIIIVFFVFMPENSNDRAVSIVLNNPYKKFREEGYGGYGVKCALYNNSKNTYICEFTVHKQNNKKNNLRYRNKRKDHNFRLNSLYIK